MINTKDLRLGNFINYDCETVKVLALSENSIKFKNDEIEGFEMFPSELYNYEKLSEEWLLRFGFEEKSKSQNFYLENFRFHISKPANYDGFIFCDGYDVITDRIKYVHQLQNLYFALTGEELTFGF